MAFWTAPSTDAVDLVTEEIAHRGAHSDRYAAIQELREISRQGLALSPEEAARANGFVRVASVQGPVLDMAILLDPDFMKDKKKFYGWLDRHPQHATYDRRKEKRSSQITTVDGKVVL